MSGTVERIDPAKLGALHRKLNKSLMVAWINADLLNRAHHDVRKSVVLYDGDKDFVYAIWSPDGEVDAELLQELYDRTTVRYMSKGI